MMERISGLIMVSMAKFKCRVEMKIMHAPAGVVILEQCYIKGSNTSQTNQQEVILNVLCGWIHDHIYEGHRLVEHCNYVTASESVLRAGPQGI